MFTDNLSNRDPGALCHAWWLTAANRIFRLYVSKRNPSKNLQILAKYIMRVYAKVWFMIKKNWQFYHSSFRESRFLPKKLREAAVDPCIRTNAFALHPENLLMAMLVDSRQEMERQAVDIVKKSRQYQKEANRKFSIPKINFKAKDYPDLIHWTNITPPPALADLSEKDIEEAINSLNKFKENLPPYPCYTQAVERTVQLVTQASKKVCCQKERDGFIRNTISSRLEIKKSARFAGTFSSRASRA